MSKKNLCDSDYDLYCIISVEISLYSSSVTFDFRIERESPV